MSNVLTINIQGLDQFKSQLANMGKKLSDGIDKELHDSADNIATKAKQLVRDNSFDTGNLANAIAGPVGSNNKYLEKRITVNAFYAPFIEFGTGRYAAQYVASLPANWQEFARKYKTGEKHGTLDDFLQKMVEWVRGKGIHGLTKGGNRKTGKKADADIYNIAYVIVISIFRNGIHPHPFLYPAFMQEQPELIKNIKNALKHITD